MHTKVSKIAFIENQIKKKKGWETSWKLNLRNITIEDIASYELGKKISWSL